jgi:hypothetical protein
LLRQESPNDVTGVVALEASDLSTTSASLSSPKLCVINDEVRAAFGEACRVWPKPDPSAALPVFAELLTYVPLMEIMTDRAHMARFYGDTYAPTLSESLQTELARAARRATRA